MFSRISQLSRHLSSPTSNFSQSAAPTITKSAPVLTAMSFPLPKFYENKNKKIQTAACLVIGDEVLGGKVYLFFFFFSFFAFYLTLLNQLNNN